MFTFDNLFYCIFYSLSICHSLVSLINSFLPFSYNSIFLCHHLQPLTERFNASLCIMIYFRDGCTITERKRSLSWAFVQLTALKESMRTLTTSTWAEKLTVPWAPCLEFWWRISRQPNSKGERLKTVLVLYTTPVSNSITLCYHFL